jgi:hypothetical protein
MQYQLDTALSLRSFKYSSHRKTFQTKLVDFGQIYAYFMTRPYIWHRNLFSETSTYLISASWEVGVTPYRLE